MNPTAEQAITYFRDMANGKSVPIAAGRKRGLGVVQSPYHMTTPTDQALTRAYESVQRQKVIRGPEDNYQAKKVIKGPAKSKKTSASTPKPGSKKQKLDEYSTPGLN